MDGEQESPCTSGTLAVDVTELASAHKVYEPRITALLERFRRLTGKEGQIKELVAVKEKLDTALRSWKDFLLASIESKECNDDAKELLKLADSQIATCESEYQEYQRECVVAMSNKGSSSATGVGSLRTRSRASSTTSSTRAAILEIKAKKILRLAEMEEERAKIEAEAMLEEAQLLREGSRSSRASSSFYSISNGQVPVKARKYAMKSLSVNGIVQHTSRIDVTAESEPDLTRKVTEANVDSRRGDNSSSTASRRPIESERIRNLSTWLSGRPSAPDAMGPAKVAEGLTDASSQVNSQRVGNWNGAGMSPTVITSLPQESFTQDVLPPMVTNFLGSGNGTKFTQAVTTPPLGITTISTSLPVPGAGGTGHQPATDIGSNSSRIVGNNVNMLRSHAIDNPMTCIGHGLPQCHSVIAAKRGTADCSGSDPLGNRNSGMGPATLPPPPSPVLTDHFGRQAVSHPQPGYGLSTSWNGQQMVESFTAQDRTSHFPPIQEFMPCKQSSGSTQPGSIQEKPVAKDDMYLFCRSLQKAILNRGPIVQKFSGDPKKYPIFIKSFKLAFWHESSDPYAVLSRLIEHCTGAANEAISHLALSDDSSVALKAAMQILEFRFGNRTLIIESYIKDLTKKERIKPNDPEGLCKLASSMRTCYMIFSTWGRQHMLDAQTYLEDIFLRLPRTVQNSYFATSTFLDVLIPSFTHLLKFVEQQAYLYNSFFGKKLSEQDSRYQAHSRKFQSKASTFAMSASTDRKANTHNPDSGQGISKHLEKCVMCLGDHFLYDCQDFVDMTTDERREFAQKKGLCRNCLCSTKHFAQACPSKVRCRENDCNRKHHALLHSTEFVGRKLSDSDRKKVNPNNGKCGENVNVFSNISCSLPELPSVRMRVIPLSVRNPSNGLAIETYAFLDAGASRSLVKPGLAEKLGVLGEPEQCRIRTFGNFEERVYSGHRVTFDICGIGLEEIITVRNGFTFENLPDVSSSIPTVEVAQRYEHLKDLTFPDLDGEIDILLGNDVLCRLPILETRLGPDECGLVGIKYPFGWVLTGPDPYLDGESDSMNFIDVYREEENSLALCRLCQMTTDLTCGVVDEFTTQPSVNDKRALALLEKSFKLDNGRITIGFPWRHDKVNLPDNYAMALKRLESLRKRFTRDRDFFEKYKDKMVELFDNGYATMEPDLNVRETDGKNWYLPHHATRQNKFRVVFDSSAECQGRSLNAELLVGPSNNNLLVGILMRFRLGKLAFSCDIRQMYHRILLDRADVNAVKFLWFPNHDFTLPPITCRMNSLIFGASASPCAAIFCLRKLANLNPTNADPVAVHHLTRSYYVDDGLISFDTEQEGQTIVTDITKLLHSGGFHLTKFLSNNPIVLESLPDADKAPALSNLELGQEAVGRTLGLTWNVKDDSFVVNVNIVNKPATRRGMLSEMSQVFDPIGIVCPVILPARLLLQELCSLGKGWDEDVPGEILSKYVKWAEKLPSLNGLSIPRCYKPPEFMATRTELHCFCDASSVAYGACAYIRFVDDRGEVHCSLVKGISRVNPRQNLSIPRLELIAAVAVVEMSREIHNELDNNFDDTFYYSDSTTVLQMIKSKSQRFKMFVANRLHVIHALSTPEQWYHVPSACNPADLASRGVAPDKLHLIDSWFVGPPMLYDRDYQWNNEFVLGESAVSIDNDIKVNVMQSESQSATVSGTSESFRTLFTKYSRFESLRTSIGWLMRFKRYFMNKWGKGHCQLSTGSLTVLELDAATDEICKLVQRDSLSAEVAHFDNQQGPGPPVQSRGKLSSPYAKAVIKCSPFVSDGLLRVGGRLRHAVLSFAQRHPIILPPYHHVTRLVIDLHHRNLGHSGTLHVLSSLRERFWILHGQSAVAKALRDCVKCRHRDARPGEQWMADLPSTRVSAGNPAFTHTYCDYFGPIMVKIGRNQYKRYGVIFTCLSTRAVHLEVAESLETSAFLQAFARFQSRRPRVKIMYSDNGTNLVAGSKELKDGIKRWNAKQIDSALAQQGCQWVFAPPLASHQGGVVERLVREVKKILRNLVGESGLTDYSLWTFMSGVEFILNDRPLTRQSDDPRDLNALSPNSILISQMDPTLPPDVFMRSDEYRKGYRHVQRLLDLFWQRFISEYLPLLQERSKWHASRVNLKRGDLVLMRDEVLLGTRGKWPKAIVIETYPDKLGLVRRVKVRSDKNEYIRDVRKLCLLESVVD